MRHLIQEWRLYLPEDNDLSPRITVNVSQMLSNHTTTRTYVYSIKRFFPDSVQLLCMLWAHPTHACTYRATEQCVCLTKCEILAGRRFHLASLGRTFGGHKSLQKIEDKVLIVHWALGLQCSNILQTNYTWELLLKHIYRTVYRQHCADARIAVCACFVTDVACICVCFCSYICVRTYCTCVVCMCLCSCQKYQYSGANFQLHTCVTPVSQQSLGRIQDIAS